MDAPALSILPDEAAPRRVHAAAGAYSIEVELKPPPRKGCLGVSRFGRRDRAAALGVAAAIPHEPDAPTGPHAGLPLTFGPSYKEADGFWVPLAGVPCSWCDIAVTPLESEREGVCWEVEYRIGGGPTLIEVYDLGPSGLRYRTHIQWVVGGFRLQFPLFATDGQRVGVPAIRGPELRLRVGDADLSVRSPDATQWWEIEEQAYASALGVFQNAYLQGRSVIAYDVTATID